MSTTTTNYGLVKPELTDVADITATNENWDLIDAKLKNIETITESGGSGLTEHIADKTNPHKVTKSQVGLGNVPNVATNDQTPTYTQATSLSTLTSGEKLSVSMGKIMKAITDLISHLANKSNPHGVTASQVGLGNVNNTADSDKPVSTAQQVALDSKAPAYTYGTDDLTAGTSALETGKLYFVYE